MSGNKEVDPQRRFISTTNNNREHNPRSNSNHSQDFRNDPNYVGRRNSQDPSHRRPYPVRLDQITDEEIDALFNTKKTYAKEANWVLPDLSKLYSSATYEFEDFQEIKGNLRTEKDKILENYPAEKWKIVQNKFGLGIFIVRILKKHYRLGHVVRNWPKAYEIFSTYPVITSGKLNSVHIGDEHGGMINALNHFLHLNFERIQWNWRATCENPYYEDGCTSNRHDDRLIFNTYKNWSFGADYSGEIRNRENIDFIVQKFQELGEINLAIVNASVGTKEDGHNKEKLVFPYQFCGLVASLKLLSKGGNLIMMSFSMYCSVNISLMYFLNTVFEHVHLYKPMSGPMTSFEFYLICLDFKKDELVTNYIEEMLKRVGPECFEDDPLFPKDDIPQTFLEQHKENMIYFTQTFTIGMKKFKYYFEKPNDEHTERWERLMRLMPRKFVNRFNIQDIDQSNKLLENSVNVRNICSGMSKLRVDYTFNQNIDCILTINILKNLKGDAAHKQLHSILEKFENNENLVTWPFEHDRERISNLPPVELVLEFGRCIKRVRKTIFVTPVSLYTIAAKVEEAFDICIVERFPCEKISCFMDAKAPIPYNFVENYGQSEREFFKKVVGSWIELEPNKITFKNVPFLTHFSVSVLRVMASFYETMTVSLDGTVELGNLKQNLSESKVVGELKTLFNGSSFQNIMWFVEMRHVSKDRFFEVISNYNTRLIMNFIRESLKYLISKNL